MTETFAEKTCTPCRGGIPPLTREQAELFHEQPQTGNCWRKLTASSGASGFAISGRHLPLFRRLVNSRKLNAIIRISTSVGAMQRSRCRPRRSRDCMRTTSSWQPRSTAYSLARPRGERVLPVLRLAPLFRCRALSSMCSRLRPRCDSAPRGVPPQDRHWMFDVFQAGGQPTRLFATGE